MAIFLKFYYLLLNYWKNKITAITHTKSICFCDQKKILTKFKTVCAFFRYANFQCIYIKFSVLFNKVFFHTQQRHFDLTNTFLVIISDKKLKRSNTQQEERQSTHMRTAVQSVTLVMPFHEYSHSLHADNIISNVLKFPFSCHMLLSYLQHTQMTCFN